MINSRRWTAWWLARGQIGGFENFEEAVRRIGTEWADKPETEIIAFYRLDSTGTSYDVKSKSLTAEMCLNDKFGDCVKTYDPSHRETILETTEPWRLTTLLVRKRQLL